MGKCILKVIGCLAALIAALAALAYFDKSTAPEYIEVYSDDDDSDVF